MPTFESCFEERPKWAVRDWDLGVYGVTIGVRSASSPDCEDRRTSVPSGLDRFVAGLTAILSSPTTGLDSTLIIDKSNNGKGYPFMSHHELF